MLNLCSHFDITLISTAATVQFLCKQGWYQLQQLCKQFLCKLFLCNQARKERSKRSKNADLQRSRSPQLLWNYNNLTSHLKRGKLSWFQLLWNYNNQNPVSSLTSHLKHVQNWFQFVKKKLLTLPTWPTSSESNCGKFQDLFLAFI